MEKDELSMMFQGLPSQRHILKHYHYDMFTWQMSHNQAAERARLMVNYPADIYLFKFGISWDGSVDCLHWRIENTFPEAEIFSKE